MKIKREVRPVKESELPTVMEVLEREVQFGVVLQYPEKDIIFPDAKLSPSEVTKSQYNINWIARYGSAS